MALRKFVFMRLRVKSTSFTIASFVSLDSIPEEARSLWCIWCVLNFLFHFAAEESRFEALQTVKIYSPRDPGLQPSAVV